MDLTPSQIARLEKLLRAGFRFVTLPHFERYFGVERERFVLLISPVDGHLTPFGQAGYLIGEGIGMLVERGTGKAFQWHNQFVEATTELLAAYDNFRAEVESLLRQE